MGTFLFDQPVFGPVKSRRLGISLGINLSPTHSKWCNYNCLYCECGWNPLLKQETILPSLEHIEQALKDKLSGMAERGEKPDVITFSGNGEPTMHPDFLSIIESTVKLRNELCKEARIAVLSNASLIHKEKVFKALQLIDDPILKLDAGSEQVSKIINQPAFPFSMKNLLKNLKRFEGNFILQSIFLRGSFEGKCFDNTLKEEVDKWLEHIKEIRPRKIMIYSLDRETPHSDLEKVSKAELEQIAQRVIELGFDIQIA